MRFIGKWLIWIGGGALLYIDLRPLVEECQQAYQRGVALGPYTVEEWLLRFARPIFVMGVICAAALPDLNRRKTSKKKVGPPLPVIPPPAAAPATPPPTALVAPGDSTPPAAL